MTPDRPSFQTKMSRGITALSFIMAASASSAAAAPVNEKRLEIPARIDVTVLTPWGQDRSPVSGVRAPLLVSTEELLPEVSPQ